MRGIALVSNEEHDHVLTQAMAILKDELLIISPFMTESKCRGLANLVKSNNIKCTIITRVCEEDFTRKVHTIEGIRLLLDAGIKVYAIKNLHSKLYIFDKKFAIITSANFTETGLKGNVELGVRIPGSNALFKECRGYFKGLVKKVEKAGKGIIDTQQLDEAVTKLNDAREQVGVHSYEDWGADISIFSEAKHRKYYILNTNYNNSIADHNDMINNNKCAAYFDPWKYNIKKIGEKDVVFLYQSGVGIVAVGEADGVLKTCDYQNDPQYKDEEYYMKLNNFSLVAPHLTARKITNICKKKFSFKKTMFEIHDKYGKKIRSEIIRRL